MAHTLRSSALLPLSACCAVAFALSGSCGGRGGGVLAGFGDAGPIVSGDAGNDAGSGDAGLDGGRDGGDAGTCAATAPQIDRVIDGCFNTFPGQQQPVTFFPNGCRASLIFAQTVTCTGTLAGASDAYSATCTNTNPILTLNCSSSSTPGTLLCTSPDAGGLSCTIAVCGANGICPP